ncbi:MAG: thiamine pyrophosphate-binding protein [Gammaproteobacteria bacterium]|nr:thiamine pyrophosphate-binding protein [Gammaproteobacteria bacterium]
MANDSATIGAADAVVRMLELHDVKHVFGVCGDTSLPLYDALARLDHGMTHILARDERCAAYMADVYARLTGKVGVVEGPSGAGATYMLPGIAEANGTSIPVLALTTDIPVTGRGKFVLTEGDQEAWFRPITKKTRVVEIPQNIAGAFRGAFNAMTTGTPGAAHIGLPYDVLKGQVDVNDLWADRSLGSYPARPTQPADNMITAAVEVIQAARKPVIICGGGVLHARAWDELQAFAEAIGAPVGTTISAKGTIAETHELALSTIGTNGSTAGSRKVVEDSDLIIYVGCHVGSVTTQKCTNPRNHEKTIIHIDIDPTCIGANYETAVALTGDARLILSALLQQIGVPPSGTASNRWGYAAVERAKAQKKQQFLLKAHSNEAPIFPERIVAEMQRAMPPDAIIVSDPGTPTPYLCAYYEAQKAGHSFIFHRTYGGLGFALPGVIGAHIAHPDRKIVGIMGDGSFGFSSGELETITRLKIPVTLIVTNNSGYSWIKAGQYQNYESKGFQVDFSCSDHAAIAAAYGLKTWKVVQPDELAPALKSALAYDGPTLIDIITRPLEELDVPVTAFLG